MVLGSNKSFSSGVEQAGLRNSQRGALFTEATSLAASGDEP